MAFLPPEQQNQYAPQGATTGAGTNTPPQTGGSAGAGSGASKSGGAPSSQGTPTQFGSSASKLGDYLTANAPQIGQQAANVTSGLNQQYGQIQGDITNAANQFGQAVQGGYAAPNQDVVNQAAANPTQFASDPNNVKAFQGQYNDTYSGPTSYENSQPYGAIQGEVQNAVQNAGLLNTQAGLQSYLGQTQGGNQTQASNTLDALLLQGNPQSQQQIQQAAGQFGNLTNQFGQSTTAADQSVKDAQTAAQNAQQYAQAQINPVGTNLASMLQGQVGTGQDAANAYNNTVNQNNQYLGNARPMLSDINAYNQTYGQQTPDALTQYLAPNGTLYNNQATINNTATQDQVNESNALAQLIGSGYQNPITDPTQAGTFNVPTANALTSPDMKSLELQGLTPATQQLFNLAYGNSPLKGTQGVTEQSNMLAGQGGAQGKAYEQLLAQLAGFNNGTVSQIPGFNQYYQVNS